MKNVFCMVWVMLAAVSAHADNEHATCDTAIEKALTRVSRTKMPKRNTGLLKAFGHHCSKAFPGLAKAAAEAHTLPIQKRIEILGHAALKALPETCRATPRLLAKTISGTCPTLEVSDALKENLSAGNYLFSLAISERARTRGTVSEPLDRLIRDLLLSSALEEEPLRHQSP